MFRWAILILDFRNLFEVLLEVSLRSTSVVVGRGVDVGIGMIVKRGSTLETGTEGNDEDPQEKGTGRN
jgi:hypothetical protein